MYQIQNLTTDPKQKQTLVLPDGTQILFTIEFVPMQAGWFIPTLSYQTFVLNGLRISNSPNMLEQFRNKIPFGLLCTSVDQREPSLQEDFFSGHSRLFILNADEVAAYQAFLTGEISG